MFIRYKIFPFQLIRIYFINLKIFEVQSCRYPSFEILINLFPYHIFSVKTNNKINS